jgi:hypothetical protein
MFNSYFNHPVKKTVVEERLKFVSNKQEMNSGFSVFQVDKHCLASQRGA